MPGCVLAVRYQSREERELPEFIHGLDLSGLFYEEAVRPVLDSGFPNLPHSAALIGYGSEVLGYDTLRSTDHEWGPRLLLFLSETDHEAYAAPLWDALSRELPPLFRGYSTHFGPPNEEGTRLPEARESGPVAHKVEVHTVGGFFNAWLGLDPRGESHPTDWLCLPQQRLLEVTAGRVYYDGLGDLGSVRQRLAYYPHDLWLYLLAAQWRRIGQEEPFMGRCGDVGDELGSRVIAARLVRDVMRLCFLMERVYAPYPKWFGTAFGRLACAPTLGPILEHALGATTWKERERYLSEAYEHVGAMHDALGITPPLKARVSRFHDRPYLVIHSDQFVHAIEAEIKDPEVLAVTTPVGAVDQWSDSTDVLSYPSVYRKLRTAYLD